jgi:Glycine rich protein
MATKTSHLLRPLVALVALVAAMAALLIAYNASPAHAAAESCTTTAGTTTCTFSTTGAEDTFEVPLGVSTIHVVATGAPGAEGFMGGTEGAGAQVSGDLTVTPGDTLYVNVGGTPTGGDCFPNVACIGGFNGGGSSSFGGGGGGASDVREVSRAEAGSLGSRLIVAGGGGGSGEGQFCGTGRPRLSGGTGGHAGSEGGDGPSCFAIDGQSGEPTETASGKGGEAGTETAGGPGGSPDGGSGSLGLGGNGGALIVGDLRRGGGGGGGLFGRGGGAPRRIPDGSALAPAGGGGGGSNLVPEGGTATLDDSGDPSIAISWRVGVGEEPPTEPEDKQACKKGGYEQFGFRNQGSCIKAVNHAN